MYITKKKEINCRINVMCLNYPKIIAYHHHPSPWKNCLPPKRSLVPKRLGIAEAEGPSFCKQGRKFQKLQAPQLPMCSLLCPSTREDSRTRLGVATLLERHMVTLHSGPLARPSSCGHTIYGWSCICPKTFLEVLYRTSGGHEGYDLRKI